MNRPLTLALLLIVSTIAGTAIMSLQARSEPYAVDGDTIDLGGQRFRLWGIQAPEIHETCGAEAREVLAQMLATAEEIQCWEAQKERSFGRVVAVCRADGVDLGRAMVAAGYATDWPAFSGYAYQPEQTLARAIGAGFWGERQCNGTPA